MYTEFEDIQLIKNSIYFDVKYYLRNNPDIMKIGIDPYIHYYYNGWKEGRNPCRFFNSHEYLNRYPDVAQSNCCPLIHFLKYGQQEGRLSIKNLDFIYYENTFIVDNNNNPSKLSISCCIIFHIYYEKNISEIFKYITNIPKNFDIYITTDSKEKINYLNLFFKKNSFKKKITYILVKNEGRDTSALLIGCKDIIKDYDIFGFLHCKKSPQNVFGRLWRDYLFNNLLLTEQAIKNIAFLFEKDPKIGMIFPTKFPFFLNSDIWDAANNKVNCQNFLKNRLKLNYSISIEDTFPVGGMFFARTKSIQNLFELNFSYNELSESNENVDGTIRHAIERLYGLVPLANGYKNIEILIKKNFLQTNNYKKNRIAIFVIKYFTDSIIPSLQALYKIAQKIILIINSEEKSISDFITYPSFIEKIIIRKNLGMDFGAWRDGIFNIGFENLKNFDELILCNDSCIFPLYDLNELFNFMDNEKTDFWGNTIELDSMEHIQSYFYVFKKNVFMSFAFKNFFASCKNLNNHNEVIKNYETKLTFILKNAGFTYSCYIRIENHHFKHTHMYAYPLAYFIAGSPFLKRKCLKEIEGFEEKLINFVKDMTGRNIQDEIFQIPKISKDIINIVTLEKKGDIKNDRIS